MRQKRQPLLLAITIAVTLTGCAALQQRSTAPETATVTNPAFIAPDIYENRTAASGRDSDLVRTNRYTLTSTAPTIGQEDLMSQIVEVTIPGTLNPSVGDAIRHALSRSGYTLHAATAESGVLYSRVLPAAHYKLGPMKLRDVLQVLAGPAWKVKVDEVTRQISFNLRSGYQLPTPPRSLDTQYANQAPIAPAQPPVGQPTTTANQSSTGVLVGTAPNTTGLQSSATTTSVPAIVTPITSLTTSPPVVPAKDGSTTTPLPPSNVAKTAPPLSPSKPVVAAPVPVKTQAIPAQAERPLRQVWTAEPGSTLRESVESWAKRANWQVIWRAEGLDYPIEARLSFEGSFTDAIGELFPLYDRAPRPFYVDVSPPSQKLIEVVEKK